ncbi:MAG: murein biosynthesis integral membrane protein MurJ [Chloroflexi bacterium]|nr:murein biosynthesis integral membrane protein MurJ [Chloroflexota bacterium]
MAQLNLTEPEVPAAGLEPAAQGQRAGIVRAAGINSLGNVASRVLGMVRGSVVAFVFGASGATGAFDAVQTVPKMVYELLVGGMLSAALVPVLSEYATAERREEMDHILSVLLTLAGAALVLVVLVLELGARVFVPLLVGGFEAALMDTATVLTRIMVPAVLIYGISGLIQAYHLARKEFVYPALGGSAHNLGLIVTVLVLAGRLDVSSLAVGVVVAAAAQLLVQLPGLRGTRLRLRFDWRHPVIRRILKLYAPVLLSIIVANAGIIIDRNLASRTLPQALTWMARATELIQISLGLVSMAISMAVLPTLSQIDARVELDRFKRTFCGGLRLVIAVIIPAAVGLLVLGEPIIRLLFEHGEFTPADTAQVSRALLYYLPGLPFAAIDLPLVFAFYAQKDTVTPVVVGIVSVLVYLAVGPLLAFAAGWGYLGLVLANSAQLISHALIMLVVFSRRFEGLGGYAVWSTAAKAAAASLLVAALSYGGHALVTRLSPLTGTLNEALLVAGPAALGILGYVAGARLLRLEEIATLTEMVRRRLSPAPRT